MDPYILASLLGGGAVNLAIWGTLGVLVWRDRRGKRQDKRSVIRQLPVKDDHLHPLFGRPVSEWERWFAWKPVHTVDQGYVFCRFVWRRRIHKYQYLYGGDDFWFQYLVKLRYVGV